MLNVFDVQLIAVSILLVGTFISGILPKFCFSTTKRHASPNNSNKICSFLIFFGGGVLMSTCFLHLLPEARETFEKEGHEQENGPSSGNITSPHVKHEHGFPIPEFIVLCGFFATYLMEEVIHLLLLGRKGLSQSAIHENRLKFCSCAQRHTECSRTFKDVKPDHSLIGLEKKKIVGLVLPADQCYSSSSTCCDDPVNVAAREFLQSSILKQSVPNYGTLSTITTPRADSANQPQASTSQQKMIGKPQRSPPPNHKVHHHNHLHIENISISSLLTVAALSFHSVFEGFAIGFQSTVVDTWTLLLAISLHKFVVAFVVGIEVVADGGRWLMVVCYIGIFSLMSPLGTTLAMFANKSVASMPTAVIGSVNSFACGTLLYVTFYEILNKELQGGVTGLVKLIAVVVGAGVMAAMQYISTVV